MMDISKCNYIVKENIGETLNYFPDASSYEDEYMPTWKILLQKIFGLLIIVIAVILPMMKFEIIIAAPFMLLLGIALVFSKDLMVG